MNQEVEQYLRLFINYHQTDWDKWLPSAEFAYNNQLQSSTNASPFFINYGKHPYTGTNPRKEIKSQSAQEHADSMKKVWEETEASLKIAAEQMKHFHDRKHSASHDFKEGQKVWLEGHNIPTDRPSKKLEDRRYGPFEILKKIGPSSFKLKLPRTWKTIHPVFNEIFLTPHHAPGRTQVDRPLPTIIEQGEEHYEVQEIMDSRLRRGKLQYLVQWEGFPERHEWTWEPLSNVGHVTESIDMFHRNNPSAPRSVDLSAIHFIPFPELEAPTNN